MTGAQDRFHSRRNASACHGFHALRFAQGWNLAFTDPSQKKLESAEEIDRRIAERLTGELEVLPPPRCHCCLRALIV
jgi:hypothetical protein